MSFIRRWIFGLECQVLTRVDGKTVIITGGNSGIGKETARELLLRGARVIIACRDLKRAEDAATDITMCTSEKANVGTIVVKCLDLASMSSIRKFAQEILETENRIDIIINNAGVMFCPYWKTEDGFEMHLGVNHLGHFLLTNLLLDRLKTSAPSRIINVSSLAHSYGKMDFDDINFEKKQYNSGAAYAQSKLANILFTVELAERLQGTGVSACALHPGVINSDLWRYSGQTVPRVIPWLVNVVGNYCMRNTVEGAMTTIFCAVADEIEDGLDLYYADCAAKKPASHSLDTVDAKRLWEISCKLTGIENKKILKNKEDF